MRSGNTVIHRPAATTRSCVHTACPPERDEGAARSEEHTSELQSQSNLVCRLLLEKKKIRGQLTASFSKTLAWRSPSCCRPYACSATIWWDRSPAADACVSSKRSETSASASAPVTS